MFLVISVLSVLTTVFSAPWRKKRIPDVKAFIYNQFLADAIPRCNSGNTTCVVGVANVFIRKFKDGNETLGIPRFEPYVYNGSVNIAPPSSGSLQISISGSNNVLEGLSTQIFQKAV